MRISKKIISLALIISLAVSCTKISVSEKNNELQIQVQEFLSQKMTAQNYNDLDWGKADFFSVEPGRPYTIMRIPSKTIANKALYIEKGSEKYLYNWAEIQDKTVTHDQYVSANVILTDIDNKIIKRFSVLNNKYVPIANQLISSKSSSLKSNSEVEITGTGGNATVVGYIKSTQQYHTYWHIDFLLSGSQNQTLLAPEPGGGGGSVSVVFENPKEDIVEADSAYMLPGGIKRFVATSYLMVVGRVITVSFNVNMTTYELVGSPDVSITGVGVYQITYLGIKKSFSIGNPNRSLFIDLNMLYSLPFVVVPGDVAFKVEWTIEVPNINHGGNRVKIY
jgi:hypothetical protein